MSTFQRFLTAAMFVAFARGASAQTILGGGVSGGGLNDRVEVNFIRETRSMPDSVHLAAVVYWRGSRGWTYSHAPADAALADSVRRALSAASLRTGIIAGGTITTTARAWVEADLHARTVSVLGKRLALPTGDSALVILVDRIDGVGGPPTLQSFPIFARAQLDATPRTHDPIQQREARRARFAELTRSWGALAEADSRVRAFIAAGSAP